MPDPAPSSVRLTGGCQCGAVRYVLAAEPISRTICHCRMCQKASGGPFMVFGRVPLDKIEWTKGALSIFRSSTVAQRGFCSACGTPLTYQWTEKAISLTLGSLDDPAAVAPTQQLGIESQLPWTADVCSLPGETSDAHLISNKLDGFTNYQHPDHDG